MQFEILGPLRVTVGGRVVDPGGGKQRWLLACLLVRANQVVPVDRLIDDLWGERPPRDAAAAVHTYVSRLRRAIDPDRGGERSPGVLVRVSPGYLLRVGADDLDAWRFERLCDEGRRALVDGDLERAASSFVGGRALWRGEVFADLSGADFVRVEAARLEQLRLAAIEQLMDAWLGLGCHDRVVADAAGVLAANPYRERLRAQLMLALYRAGRQVEALRVYREGRDLLVNELGLEPSAELQALEDDILLHKPHLDWRPPARRPRATVGPLPRQARVPPGRPGTFVGRQVELATLVAAWRRALDGGRQLVVVSGEPGIGKTRLADEVAAVALTEGATVLYGAAHPDSVVPYQPFVEAFGDYAADVSSAVLGDDVDGVDGVIGWLVPTLARRVPGVVVPARADSMTERYVLFEAAATLLGRLAERFPVVVVLDDLQWADHASWLLLAHLARGTAPMRLLVVATLRDEVGERAPSAAIMTGLRRDGVVGHVRLGGLDGDAVADLVVERLAGPASAGFAAAVAELSSGNPFFVEQLLDRVEELRVESGTLDAAMLGVPDGVREVITQRVRVLSAASQRSLGQAAVVGQEFDLDVVAAVSDVGPDALLDGLDEAVTAGLLVEVPGCVGRYRFAHALTREALYGGLTVTRRARLHHAVGAAIEQLRRDRLEEHLGTLAHHFLTAGLEPVTAARYAAQAGAAALGRLADEEATILFERGLAAIDGVADGADVRCDLLLGLAEAHGRGGDVASAHQAIDAAAGQARAVGDAERLAQAALATPRGLLWVLPEPEEVSVTLLEDALSGLDPEDSVLRSRLLGRLAVGLHFRGQRDRALTSSQAAVDTARRLHAGEALARALTSRHTVLQEPAHVEQRLAITRDIVHVAERLGDRELEITGRYLPVADHLELGDLAAADAAMVECEARIGGLRQPLLRLLVVQHQAMRAIMSGRLDDGERLAHDALRLARAAGYHYAQTFGSLIFQLRWFQGRLGEIEPQLAHYLQRDEQYSGWRAALAMVYAETGRLDEARSHFDIVAATNFADSRFDHTWTTVMVTNAETCAALGDTDRAATLHRLLVPYAHRTVVLGHGAVCLGALARTLGLLATVLEAWAEAEHHFGVAEDLNQRLNTAPLVARTHVDHARMLLTRRQPGDTDQAERLLAEARSTATRLGLGGLNAKLALLGG